MQKLTNKQEKFVQELIKGKSQREAYKLVYNASKMSNETIDVKASVLFNSGKVAERYNEIHSRLVKEAEDECIITAKEILKELKHTAFDNIGNYISFKTDEGGQINLYIKDSSTIDTRNISEITLGKDGQFKFKLYSKHDALVQLGKHLGMFDLKQQSLNLEERKFNLAKQKAKGVYDIDPETGEIDDTQDSENGCTPL